MGNTKWGTLYKESTATLEGDFTVTIVEATPAQTSTGKDQIKCKMKVESGPYAGRVIFNNFVISPESPNAMRMFFQHLGVLGLDEEFFNSLPGDNTDNQLIANALKNRRAVVTMGSEKYQGQDRERVKGWKPAEGGPGGELGLGAFPSGGVSGLSGMSTGSVGIPASVPAVPASVPSVPAVASSVPSAAPSAIDPAELDDPF